MSQLDAALVESTSSHSKDAQYKGLFIETHPKIDTQKDAEWKKVQIFGDREAYH